MDVVPELQDTGNQWIRESTSDDGRATVLDVTCARTRQAAVVWTQGVCTRPPCLRSEAAAVDPLLACKSGCKRSLCWSGRHCTCHYASTHGTHCTGSMRIYTWMCACTREECQMPTALLTTAKGCMRTAGICRRFHTPQKPVRCWAGHAGCSTMQCRGKASHFETVMGGF